MTRLEQVRLTKRILLAASVASAIALVGCGGKGGGKTSATTVAASASAAPAATPPCDAEHRLTPEQTEGPYFKPNSPERASLVEPGMAGTRLTIAGTVLSTACKPVAGALLDFWQADDKGNYDNAGQRLRGRQVTGADGRYKLETIVPGLYPGRTRHIHVKVQAPNQSELATQLYFAGEPANETDSIFNAALVMDVQQEGGGKVAGFDFVLDLGR